MNDNAMVYYGATPDGYEVTVSEGCNVLDHYSVGNNPNDSYQLCPPEVTPVPLRTLRKWARDTAYSMAKEHGVPHHHVFEDNP